jgi:catechol 2,3-dioxygenase-like lactoylglutathione lyase family enzyme
MVYPRAFSHIGITVTDLEKAEQWYHEVLGCYILQSKLVVTEDDRPIGQTCTDIFGPGFKRFRFSHLTTSDGIGLELFEFSPPIGAPREQF